MPTVLITGANRGIGLEFARQYAADGWRVVATCRDPEGAKDLNALTGDISVFRLDVTDADQVAALAQELNGQAIDVLLNNAGVFGPVQPFGAIDYDAWLDVLRANTLAPLRVSEAFVEHVANSTQKKIVALTSNMGSIGDNDRGGYYIYRSSKAALNAAMKSLAIDLAGRGITACVLHPGWVQTDMGGPSALITTQESATGMRGVIESLNAARSGRYFKYDGTELIW